MTTDEDKPVSEYISLVDKSGSELLDAYRRRERTDSEDITPNEDQSEPDQTISEVNERKIVFQEKPAKARKKSKANFSIVLSGIFVAMVISYYVIKNLNGPGDPSGPVKKDHVQSVTPKNEPDRTEAKESNTISLQREKPEIQRDSSPHQNVSQARKKLSDVKLKSPEKIERLPQTDGAISEKTPITVGQFSGPAVSLQLIAGVDKIVPYFEENVSSYALSYPYSVHLGSFRTLKRVQKAESIYRKMGLSPYWIKVDLGNKGVWYRVFTGWFKNKEEADAFIKENQIAGASSKRTRYATLIGTYTSEETLEMKRLALSELGYSPYMIDGINGEYRLYSGAFFQKVSAEKHSANLASKGIQSQAVER